MCTVSGRKGRRPPTLLSSYTAHPAQTRRRSAPSPVRFAIAEACIRFPRSPFACKPDALPLPSVSLLLFHHLPLA
ncbi:hypothetical protein OPV22_004512 [Ensete ventricosum]|uniref:Uncharacterized protein n=1 Tax=Ensete ventricosum TaxID=4639 RepID=A0AAV8S3S5_ENSVE|nr:hypothetical protein OPV22_004512 [Ensete ventricosum]RWV78298.1 hypothetical protein GW17_00060751 [Ensete ventricosum]